MTILRLYSLHVDLTTKTTKTTNSNSSTNHTYNNNENNKNHNNNHGSCCCQQQEQSTTTNNTTNNKRIEHIQQQQQEGNNNNFKNTDDDHSFITTTDNDVTSNPLHMVDTQTGIVIKQQTTTSTITFELDDEYIQKSYLNQQYYNINNNNNDHNQRNKQNNNHNMEVVVCDNNNNNNNNNEVEKEEKVDKQQEEEVVVVVEKKKDLCVVGSTGDATTDHHDSRNHTTNQYYGMDESNTFESATGSRSIMMIHHFNTLRLCPEPITFSSSSLTTTTTSSLNHHINTSTTTISTATANHNNTPSSFIEAKTTTATTTTKSTTNTTTTSTPSSSYKYLAIFCPTTLIESAMEQVFDVMEELQQSQQDQQQSQNEKEGTKQMPNQKKRTSNNNSSTMMITTTIPSFVIPTMRTTKNQLLVQLPNVDDFCTFPFLANTSREIITTRNNSTNSCCNNNQNHNNKNRIVEDSYYSTLFSKKLLSWIHPSLSHLKIRCILMKNYNIQSSQKKQKNHQNQNFQGPYDDQDEQQQQHNPADILLIDIRSMSNSILFELFDTLHGQTIQTGSEILLQMILLKTVTIGVQQQQEQEIQPEQLSVTTTTPSQQDPPTHTSTTASTLPSALPISTVQQQPLETTTIRLPMDADSTDPTTTTTSIPPPPMLGTTSTHQLSTWCVDVPTCPVCLHRIDPYRLGLPKVPTYQLCSKFCPIPPPQSSLSLSTTLSHSDSYENNNSSLYSSYIIDIKMNTCPRQRLLRPWPRPNLCQACVCITHYWNHNQYHHLQQHKVPIQNRNQQQQPYQQQLRQYQGLSSHRNRMVIPSNPATRINHNTELSSLSLTESNSQNGNDDDDKDENRRKKEEEEKEHHHDIRCIPTTRFSQMMTTMEDPTILKCYYCSMQETLWVCLTCAFIGCGRYSNKHASQHYLEHSHPYCLELSTGRIWSYIDSEYVHRIDFLHCSCSPYVQQQYNNNNNNNVTINHATNTSFTMNRHQYYQQQQQQQQQPYYHRGDNDNRHHQHYPSAIMNESTISNHPIRGDVNEYVVHERSTNNHLDAATPYNNEDVPIHQQKGNRKHDDHDDTMNTLNQNEMDSLLNSSNQQLDDKNEMNHTVKTNYESFHDPSPDTSLNELQQQQSLMSSSSSTSFPPPPQQQQQQLDHNTYSYQNNISYDNNNHHYPNSNDDSYSDPNQQQQQQLYNSGGGGGSDFHHPLHHIDEKIPQKTTMIGVEYEALLQSALEEQSHYYEGQITALRARLTAEQVDRDIITDTERVIIEQLQSSIGEVRNLIDTIGMKEYLEYQSQETGYRAISQKLDTEQRKVQDDIVTLTKEIENEKNQYENQVIELRNQINDLTANEQMKKQLRIQQKQPHRTTSSKKKNSSTSGTAATTGVAQQNAVGTATVNRNHNNNNDHDDDDDDDDDDSQYPMNEFLNAQILISSTDMVTDEGVNSNNNNTTKKGKKGRRSFRR